MHILNAGSSSFPVAWQGYQACASHNLKDWFRVATSYDASAGVLTIEHTVKSGMVCILLILTRTLQAFLYPACTLPGTKVIGYTI